MFTVAYRAYKIFLICNHLTFPGEINPRAIQIFCKYHSSSASESVQMTKESGISDRPELAGQQDTLRKNLGLRQSWEFRMLCPVLPWGHLWAQQPSLGKWVSSSLRDFNTFGINSIHLQEELYKTPANSGAWETFQGETVKMPQNLHGSSSGGSCSTKGLLCWAGTAPGPQKGRQEQSLALWAWSSPRILLSVPENWRCRSTR